MFGKVTVSELVSNLKISVQKGIRFISNKIELYSNKVYLVKTYRKQLYEIHNDQIPVEYLHPYRQGKLLDVRDFKFPNKDEDFNAYKYITPKSKHETISVDGKLIYDNIIYESRVLNKVLIKYRELKQSLERYEREIEKDMEKTLGYAEMRSLEFEKKIALEEKERILKNYNHYVYVITSIVEDSEKLLELYIKQWQKERDKEYFNESLSFGLYKNDLNIIGSVLQGYKDKYSYKEGINDNNELSEFIYGYDMEGLKESAYNVSNMDKDEVISMSIRPLYEDMNSIMNTMKDNELSGKDNESLMEDIDILKFKISILDNMK